MLVRGSYFLVVRLCLLLSRKEERVEVSKRKKQDDREGRQREEREKEKERRERERGEREREREEREERRERERDQEKKISTSWCQLAKSLSQTFLLFLSLSRAPFSPSFLPSFLPSSLPLTLFLFRHQGDDTARALRREDGESGRLTFFAQRLLKKKTRARRCFLASISRQIS